MTKKEIDSVTGVETTGHVWDGDEQRQEQDQDHGLGEHGCGLVCHGCLQRRLGPAASNLAKSTSVPSICR